MIDRQRLKSLLLSLSYEKREVVLASGKKSNFYFNGKQTSLHPEGAYLLGHALYDLIVTKYPTVEAVGGPTLGADPLVTSIAFASFNKPKKIPAFIIRKEPKKHGTQAWIEGDKNVAQGSQVVIVEDVITSGGSALTACEKAKECGLHVIGVVSIIDREEGGREALKKAGFNLEVLFVKSDLIGRDA